MSADHTTESAGITAPHCASLGCDRAGFIKSERWGASLCPLHALTGPLGQNPEHPCGNPQCPGDGRYAPPGRGHVVGCTNPTTPPDMTGGA